ncbi:response regulator transcription factor [Alteromonas halophila]|uniref:Phosphate regulon transcriptional regulatory protein PhoB n=1 Tax=Alteromonas halophila TaxID=516698 RepID=A0A918JHY6_9ALTE|nr:response regulator transcription factor [Alteromonas halophila]GGW80902.1 DNA-binding response regulator [Alteromonas halophila]
MILVVQSVAMYQQHISESLKETGLAVECVSCFDDALGMLRQTRYTMVILDCDIGSDSGFTLCQIIRHEDLASVIVFVGATSTTSDRVLALELGADDFIRYPCQARELQARVHAALRRQHPRCTTQSGMQPDSLRCGCITIDEKRHQVWVNEQPVNLTATEFTLLQYLASHANQVFSRAQLLAAVWDYHHSGYEHTVNSHINRLRSKLGPGAAAMIETVWGVGYKCCDGNTLDRQRHKPAAVVPLRQSI